MSLCSSKWQTDHVIGHQMVALQRINWKVFLLFTPVGATRLCNICVYSYPPGGDCVAGFIGGSYCIRQAAPLYWASTSKSPNITVYVPQAIIIIQYSAKPCFNKANMICFTLNHKLYQHNFTVTFIDKCLKSNTYSLIIHT